MSDDLVYQLRESLDAANARADAAERQLRVLRAGLCGECGEIHPRCHELIVLIADKMRKTRVRRDGR